MYEDGRDHARDLTSFHQLFINPVGQVFVRPVAHNVPGQRRLSHLNSLRLIKCLVFFGTLYIPVGYLLVFRRPVLEYRLLHDRLTLLARKSITSIYRRILKLGLNSHLVLDHFRGKTGVFSLFAFRFVNYAFFFRSIDGVNLDFLHILIRS